MNDNPFLRVSQGIQTRIYNKNNIYLIKSNYDVCWAKYQNRMNVSNPNYLQIIVCPNKNVILLIAKEATKEPVTQ